MFSATLADANNTVNAVEYAINTEAANGSNFPISITSAQTVTLTNVAISSAAFNSVNDGTCTLYVHGEDAAGNWGPWSTGMTFERDTAAPTIILTGTPVTGSSTNSAPSISAAISAIGATNTVAAAEYFIDTTGAASTGTPLGGVVGGQTATLTAAIPQAAFLALPDGSHTILVHALDLAGNWGTTYATYTFTKNMNIPTATVTAPTSVANTSPLSFTVAFSASVSGLSTSGFTVTNGGGCSLSGSGAELHAFRNTYGAGAVDGTGQCHRGLQHGPDRGLQHRLQRGGVQLRHPTAVPQLHHGRFFHLSARRAPLRHRHQRRQRLHLRADGRL